jgi:hypothetical protein
MRSMVKLHDLVDLVEPLWGGVAEASSSGRPQDEAMELVEAMENWVEEAMEALTTPGEPNVGLGVYLCFSSIFIRLCLSLA